MKRAAVLAIAGALIFAPAAAASPKLTATDAAVLSSMALEREFGQVWIGGRNHNGYCGKKIERNVRSCRVTWRYKKKSWEARVVVTLISWDDSGVDWTYKMNAHWKVRP